MIRSVHLLQRKLQQEGFCLGKAASLFGWQVPQDSLHAASNGGAVPCCCPAGSRQEGLGDGRLLTAWQAVHSTALGSWGKRDAHASAAQSGIKAWLEGRACGTVPRTLTAHMMVCSMARADACSKCATPRARAPACFWPPSAAAAVAGMLPAGGMPAAKSPMAAACTAVPRCRSGCHGAGRHALLARVAARLGAAMLGLELSSRLRFRAAGRTACPSCCACWACSCSRSVEEPTDGRHGAAASRRCLRAVARARCSWPCGRCCRCCWPSAAEAGGRGVPSLAVPLPTAGTAVRGAMLVCSLITN